MKKTITTLLLTSAIALAAGHAHAVCEPTVPSWLYHDEDTGEEVSCNDLIAIAEDNRVGIMEYALHYSQDQCTAQWNLTTQGIRENDLTSLETFQDRILGGPGGDPAFSDPCIETYKCDDIAQLADIAQNSVDWYDMMLQDPGLAPDPRAHAEANREIFQDITDALDQHYLTHCGDPGEFAVASYNAPASIDVVKVTDDPHDLSAGDDFSVGWEVSPWLLIADEEGINGNVVRAQAIRLTLQYTDSANQLAQCIRVDYLDEADWEHGEHVNVACDFDVVPKGSGVVLDAVRIELLLENGATFEHTEVIDKLIEDEQHAPSKAQFSSYRVNI